jgi:hypothetical protein
MPSQRLPDKSVPVRKPAQPKQSVGAGPAKSGKSGSIPAAGLLQRAATDPASLAPAEVLALQRVGGNRAVQRLLAAAGPLQRDAAGSLAGGPVHPQTEALLRQSRGGGQRLDAQVSEPIGAAMGADFSAVRVHTDTQADQLNRSLSARAFTLGGDIYFRQGHYDPASSSGRHLLAHELTHVVQQGGGQPALQTSLVVGPAGDRYEKEADAVANNVMRRLSQPQAKQPEGDEAAAQMAGQPARPLAVSRALAGPRLQRAMGWEFETGYVVEKEQGNAFVPLSKMDVIKDYGEGLKMTADTTSLGTSVIEMVLDPPVQEHQPEGMTKSLAKFTKIGKALDDIRLRGNQQAAPQKLNKVSGLDAPSKFQVTPTGMGFYGNPQITGGVRFDRLYDFLNSAANQPGPTEEHGKAKSELSGYLSQKDTASLTGAGVEVGRVNGSPELKGMVALLAMYLRYGAAGQGKGMFNYAKLLGDTFMARTDFGAMFARLPDKDFDRYTKAPNTFVTLVLDAAGLSGTGGTKVYERGIRKSYDKKSPDYNVDLTGTVPDLAITRQNWLLGITLGEDRISSSGMPRLKAELEGLGALGARTDRVGGEVVPGKKKQPSGGSGIILEMRKLKDNQSYGDFVATAQRVFDYLVVLNQ